MSADSGDNALSRTLLEREAELLAMNAEIDKRRAAADEALRRASKRREQGADDEARAVPRHVREGISGYDAMERELGSIDSDRSDVREHAGEAGSLAAESRSPARAQAGMKTPGSPAVRTAADASAKRRTRDLAGGAPDGASPISQRSPSARQPTSARSSGSGEARRGSARRQVKPVSSAKRRSVPATPPPVHADDEDGEAMSGLGSEAQARYHNARLRVLKDERDAAVAARKEMELRLSEALDRVRAGADERKRLTRAVSAAENEAARQKKSVQRIQSKTKGMEAQVRDLTKELADVRRESSARGTDGASQDVRLQRALDEVARLKGKLRATETDHQSNTSGLQRQVGELKAELRKVERQKAELLSAFKKQLRLIDVLKRQKVHMEAARMLAFTEEEFAKTLERGV